MLLHEGWDDYQSVAGLMNHIDQDWTLNEGVRKSSEGPVRSTSTGDVVVLSDGSVNLCCAVGWKAVGSVNDAPLVFTSGGLKFSLLPAGGQK